MQEKWLLCAIHKGMFRDELVAQYGSESFFVPRDKVQQEGASGATGKLRVKSFERDSNWFAVLPTDYQDVLSVEKGDLVAA